MPLFTAGIFLFSALAVVVPLALHLLHKRQPQPIKFAAVRFMRDAIAKSRRSRHLTQGLTLLMRCLILLLLAFAFSQPFLRQSNYLPEGRRKLLVVLDGTASMQAHDGESSVFEKCKDWIADLLDELHDGDLVALLVASEDGTLRVVPPITDHAHIREVLAEARCSQGAVDMAESIRDVFREDGGLLTDFELHVFSDFQQGSWRSESIGNLSGELTRRHCAVFLNNPQKGGLGDAGVMELSFSPAQIFGDGLFSCTYRLAHTQSYAGSLTVRLLADGKEQDQLTAVLPGADLTERLTGQAEAANGRVELVGEVAIDEDGYRLNDRRYFCLPRLNGQPAMIVNGSGDARDSFFLTRAISPRGAAVSLLAVETKDWAGLVNTSNLSDYAVLFICNPPPMDGTVVEQLLSYVKGGGLAVFFPGELNGLTEATVQRLCDSSNIQIPSETLPEEQRFELTSEAFDNAKDAFSRRLTAMIPPPWSVTARRRLPFKLTDSAASHFIRYVSKNPKDARDFIVRRNVGNGEVMVFSVSANRDWSDLPLTPFFFVLVQELGRHGAGYRHRDLQTTVGGELALSAVGSPQDVSTIHATDMNGKKIELAGSLDASGRLLLVSGFHSLGITNVELPWGETRQVAVNLPDAESSLDSLSSSELSDGRFGNVPVAYSATHEELRTHMNLAGRRFPLSPWLLLAAFALSMVEVIYANIRSLRTAQPKTVETLLKHGGGVA